MLPVMHTYAHTHLFIYLFSPESVYIYIHTYTLSGGKKYKTKTDMALQHVQIVEPGEVVFTRELMAHSF